MLKLVSVCGARPNFMKIAALCRAFAARPDFRHVLVHTGQHYDDLMDRRFFEELRIPRPDVNLGVGSASHAVQTAAIMQGFEPLVLDHKPDAVLVVGDVNSTLAAALVAAKLCIPVIHVEAGLRSFDRAMPEEINRLVTDALSDLLFVTERAGEDNLRREGVPAEKIHFVGNVMIDTLRWSLDLADGSDILQRIDLAPRAYAVLTLHRPSNVDREDSLLEICDALSEISRAHAVVFPVHPRTRAALGRSGIAARLAAMPGLRLLDPLGYLDFLKLMSNAGLVLTDSGGIQEETTALGVPCLTLRDNTERPVTVEQGTNRLVGRSPQRILEGYRLIVSGGVNGRVPDLWDGRAAERIADIILAWSRARAAGSWPATTTPHPSGVPRSPPAPRC